MLGVDHTVRNDAVIRYLLIGLHLQLVRAGDLRICEAIVVVELLKNARPSWWAYCTRLGVVVVHWNESNAMHHRIEYSIDRQAYNPGAAGANAPLGMQCLGEELLLETIGSDQYIRWTLHTCADASRDNHQGPFAALTRVASPP